MTAHKTDTDAGRAALEAYLKDCESHAIVPDVGGAFFAGRASLAASAGSEPVAWLVSGGRIFVDKPFLSQGAALRNASERNDGSAVVPLYTHPSPPEGMVGGWRPIAEAPQDGRTLLLGRLNANGLWRTMRGEWMDQDHIDEYAEEPADMQPGWYETTVEDNGGECWRIEPTHFMELPAPPIAAGGGKDADHG